MNPEACTLYACCLAVPPAALYAMYVVAAAAGGGAWFSYAIEDVGLVLVLAHWCINYIARTQWSAAASGYIFLILPSLSVRRDSSALFYAKTPGFRKKLYNY